MLNDQRQGDLQDLIDKCIVFCYQYRYFFKIIIFKYNKSLLIILLKAQKEYLEEAGSEHGLELDSRKNKNMALDSKLKILTEAMNSIPDNEHKKIVLILFIIQYLIIINFI